MDELSSWSIPDPLHLMQNLLFYLVGLPMKVGGEISLPSHEYSEEMLPPSLNASLFSHIPMSPALQKLVLHKKTLRFCQREG